MFTGINYFGSLLINSEGFIHQLAVFKLGKYCSETQTLLEASKVTVRPIILASGYVKSRQLPTKLTAVDLKEQNLLS